MTDGQKERYSRHILLKEVDEVGQQKLLQAKVLVVGAGGLGSPVLQYLAAAGIGCIGIVEADKVSLSNLQRQVLYREDQIGRFKVEIAKQTLIALNGGIIINTYNCFLSEGNAKEIISKYDIVVGATDNFHSRILIDAITSKLSIPFVHGSVGEFEGQVSVFNFKNGPSYSNLFPEMPDDCDQIGGVMGYLPGVVGSLMVAEVIKIILDIGKVLSGRLLVYNSLDVTFTEIEF